MDIQIQSSQVVEKSRFCPCITSKLVSIANKIKKTGTDDPRRVIHSLKVGLGLTLVSTFYYVNPIFKDLGSSVMWAVLTVVLVMEFFVGAAVLKGLNRACATFLAGALGLAAHRFAVLFGEPGEAIVLGVIIFSVAALATFARFVPELKARYDYGVMIFILTFCLVAVSSYRKDNVVEVAKDRFLMIAIGVAISFFTSILILPVWAGQELHRLETWNLEKLANFLKNYSELLECQNSTSPSLDSHKSVLSSKSSEDSLSSMARWEPPHGKFRLRHPWDQYLKIGAQSRQCAYLMETLRVYSVKSLPKHVQEMCVVLSMDCSKALSGVASIMSRMDGDFSSVKFCVAGAAASEGQLRASLSENYWVVEDKEIICTAPIVSLSVEIVRCVEDIVGAVEELARLAKFGTSEEVVVKGGKKMTDDGEAADISVVIDACALSENV